MNKFPFLVNYKKYNFFSISNEKISIYIIKNKDFFLIYKTIKEEIVNNFIFNFKQHEKDLLYKIIPYQIISSSGNIDEESIDKILLLKNENLKIISNILNFSFYLNLDFFKKTLFYKFSNKISILPSNKIELNIIQPLILSFYNKDNLNEPFFNIEDYELKESYIFADELSNSGIFANTIYGSYFIKNIFNENINDNLIECFKYIESNNIFKNIIVFSITPIELINNSQNIIEVGNILINQNRLNIYNYFDFLISDKIIYNYHSDDKISINYIEYDENFKYEYSLKKVVNKRDFKDVSSIFKRTLDMLI